MEINPGSSMLARKSTKNLDLMVEYLITTGKIIMRLHFTFYSIWWKRWRIGCKVSSSYIFSVLQIFTMHFCYCVADPENVVVIHCNSGKGRAGTATCCLLVYLGFYDTVYEAAKLFSSRRFTDGKGISQPCQVRFIHYFQAFF